MCEKVSNDSGSAPGRQFLKGRCHCGAVQFEFDRDATGQPPSSGWEIKRCNCSLCKRKGALMLTAHVGRFRVTRGAECLSLYQWNHKIARHYFCRLCGIYTHHQRRSNPLEIGVNVGCVDVIDPDQCTTILMGDGASMSVVE